VTTVHATGEVAMSGRTASATVLADGAGDLSGATAAADARAWLAVAEQARRDGDADTASKAALKGLDALGDAYLEPGGSGVEDDTRQRLRAAEIATDADRRATLRTRTLADRIEMFGWRHADRAVGFDPPLVEEGTP
jgi:hypothetical protein